MTSFATLSGGVARNKGGDKAGADIGTAITLVATVQDLTTIIMEAEPPARRTTSVPILSRDSKM